MKLNTLLYSSVALIAAGMTAHAATFITPTAISSSTAASDLWPASNLIEGPGVGYDAAVPHLGNTDDGANGTRQLRNWVTDNAGQVGLDYFGGTNTAPILTIDMGSDTLLGAINTWQYWHGSANQNSTSSFTLRFATDAEGTAGFGTSITYSPTFVPDYDNTIGVTPAREQFTFLPGGVTARYIELTATDNFVGDPDVSAGGGDRVAFSEIAFETVPEPSTGLLGLLGFVFALRRRR